MFSCVWLLAAVLSGMLSPRHSTAAEPAASIWLDEARRPNASARDALQLLTEAATEGLEARDYHANELNALAAGLDGSARTAQTAETFGQALGASMLRYLQDLHLGRIHPRALGFRIEPRRSAPDFAGLLHKAVASGTLRQTAAELRPTLGQYTRLREALAHYRTLAAGAAPGPLLARPPARPVKPGDTFPDASALRQRLIALGDLPSDAPPAIDRHDGAVPEGVRRFQARHGLEPDGVLGRATWAALNTPLADRVQQLELALERLRWLPELGTRSFIGINIPMFRLWAWDPARRTERPLVDMGVVVGRALDTQTPVLLEEMRYIVFRPFWNVPRSILMKELLPAIVRDPAYLQQHDMEIVRGAGDDARSVEASPENLALLRDGVLRLRQRPGPRNSLGLVKFIFPNDDNVYLHDTPATQLFSRDRRDFSHGCVRVHDAVALAEWVLRDQAPPWTRERIEAAMAGPAPLRADLAQPLMVLLFYMTAMVMPADGSLHFAQDIYGHDARLRRALAQRTRPSPPTLKAATVYRHASESS